MGCSRAALPSGAALVLVSAVLLACALALPTQLVYENSLSLSTQSTPATLTADHATTMVHAFTSPSSLDNSLEIAPLHAALASTVSKSVAAGTGKVSALFGVSWGLFQLRLTLNAKVAVNGKALIKFNFHSDIFIDQECVADMTTLINDVNDKFNIPGHVPSNDAFKKQVINKCALYNASRGFAVLAVIALALSIICGLLLWRRKVPLVSLAVSTALSSLFSIISFALMIALKFSDQGFIQLNDFTSSTRLPGVSFGFGASFALLVAGAAVALVASICVKIEMRRRKGLHFENGHLSLEAGMMNVHVDVYRRM